MKVYVKGLQKGFSEYRSIKGIEDNVKGLQKDYSVYRSIFLSVRSVRFSLFVIDGKCKQNIRF